MGADIHGVWECRLPNGTWAVFRDINNGKNYEWFGILSGVRAHGPRCSSTQWDPRREYDVGEYWLEVCKREGLFSHTLVSIPALRQANEVLHLHRAEWNPAEVAASDWEPEPSLDETVDEIWVGGTFVGKWVPIRPHVIPMRIPLREVLGLGPSARIEDAFDLLRMVVAYDS